MGHPRRHPKGCIPNIPRSFGNLILHSIGEIYRPTKFGTIVGHIGLHEGGTCFVGKSIPPIPKGRGPTSRKFWHFLHAPHRTTIAIKLCILLKQDKIKIFTGSTTLAKIFRDTPSVCGFKAVVFIGLATLTKTTSQDQDQDTKHSLKRAARNTMPAFFRS